MHPVQKLDLDPAHDIARTAENLDRFVPAGKPSRKTALSADFLDDIAKGQTRTRRTGTPQCRSSRRPHLGDGRR